MLARLAGGSSRRVTREQLQDLRMTAKSDWAKKGWERVQPGQYQKVDVSEQTGKVCQSRKASVTDFLTITGRHGNYRRVNRFRQVRKATHESLKDNPGGDDGPVPFAKSEGPGLFHFLAAFDP